MALSVLLSLALIGCTSGSASEPSPTAAEAAALPTVGLTVQAAVTEPPATMTPRPSPTATAPGSPTAPATAPATVTVSLTPTVAISLTGTVTATGNLDIDPAAVNGIPVAEIAILPPEVADNVRQIYQRGQVLGRNINAFSKLGDSLIATPSFFTQFDTGQYDLGGYAYLQPAIDFFAGSYERYGVALRPGLHAWGVFDPLWANKDWCNPNEDLLACEIRLNNPGVLLILLGTNDAGNPPGFDYNMRKVVEYTIDQGIIPVIVTKADRFEGPDNINNEILRQIAADFQVPLWDFDRVAGTIAERGLTEDQVHLTVFPENDYTLPEAYQTGHGIHNLTGLMILEAVRQAITS